MQGPAPNGFHVPLNTERQAVKDIRRALGGGSYAGTNFGIALKLPFAGYRYYSTASVGLQGSGGRYWSSSRSNTDSAYYLSFSSTSLSPQNSNYRAHGLSIRCFKNSPVVPTSSWTKLYGTSIEAGGIFWSSSEGLISLSSDGNTWITIADKNLGAAQVWNSGDTLSEANCGKYYQRGNNYGFPRAGSVTTSSTQVDASTYGPGNYYSSDTFIKYNGRWDTTDNGNLRGGVTGVKPMSELKNAYIGEVWESSWDIATAIQDQSIQPTSISNNRCIDVSSDGYHILLSNERGPVTEYTLSVPFDLTSTITTQTASLKSYTYTDCVLYSDDGKYVYISNTSSGSQSGYSYLDQRELGTPFDISTAGSVIHRKQTSSGYRLGGFRFYDNGSKIIGATRDFKIVSGTLSTAWDISTLGTLTTQCTQSASSFGTGNGFTISTDGLHCYTVEENATYIRQYDTTTAYDFTSNTQNTVSTSSLSSSNFGVDVSIDGRYMFLAKQNGTIYRYSFTKG